MNTKLSYIKLLLRHAILIVCLLVAGMARADYLFKTLDSRNLLNSNQINCILKDSKGFMWFGTPSGLYRYDGYTFKDFQSNSQDGSSLPDSYIVSLQESIDGNIWVETASGLCIYRPESESFERDIKQAYAKMGITDIPQVAYIDSHKNLWAYVPGRGVLAYDMQQQLLYEFSYTNDIKGIPQGEIVSIGECKEGAVLVYKDATLSCCDILHQQHTVWTTYDIANAGLRASNSLKVYADDNDNIWLYGKGTLMIYSRQTNTWNTGIGSRLGSDGQRIDRMVNGVDGDSEGNIWIATEGSGLIRFSGSTLEMEEVEPRGLHNTQRAELLKNIRCVYVDDTDLLWVGTEKAGVAFYGDDIYKFEYEYNGDVSAITQDLQTMKMWFGTSSHGVIGYDGQLASQKVACMAYTPDGSIWVGSAGSGLTRIKDGKSTIYSSATDDGKGLIDDHINDLCSDKAGNLWIATSGGLQVFNPRMNAFSTYTMENGKLTTNNITALAYGKNNNLFVGTNEGLTILNLSTADTQHLVGNKSNLKKLTNDYITQLLQDSRSLLWIGTREGVNILDIETDSLYYITEREGLCNNCVNGLGEDGNTNVWITTSNGISRAVVQRDHVDATYSFGLYNYDMSDGLLRNEFNDGSIFTPSDGNVIMGNVNGVNWIRERSKEAQEELPRVMLTQLYLDETEVMTGHDYGGSVILPQALNESNSLKLASDQNTFTIKFAAGNYNQCERLQFMYWMEGKDDGWRGGDALTHGVTFRNLASGSYRLHVKAVSADGAVSKQERTLDIRIMSPWWKQWWMIIVYVAIAIALFYLWKICKDHFFYLYNKKKTVVGELQRQREEIKAASDELKQPMSRMASIMGNIAETADNVETQEQVNALHAQMLHLITRISEMQSYIENPEEKADKTASTRLQLNDQGEVKLLTENNEEITSSFSSPQKLATQDYRLMVVDDNDDFLQFIRENLGNIYALHTYNTTQDAMMDIDTLKPHLIVCKQDMPDISGSALCNQVKTNYASQRIKFVLMTDSRLTPQEMTSLNITLSADDYMAKPFNMQEAVMRFNRLLGLNQVEGLSPVIEGSETRRLEGSNASMTTATIHYDQLHHDDEGGADSKPVIITPEGEIAGKDDTETEDISETGSDDAPERQEEPITDFLTTTQRQGELALTGADFSMADASDRLLMRNIEQYVLHNMSRGHINLEEMAQAMGMGRVPFYHKVRTLTKKTPAELVRELKLKHACTLLVKTDINLTELAVNVGFVTAENFITIFKDKFKMSPLEYRLKERNKK